MTLSIWYCQVKSSQVWTFHLSALLINNYQQFRFNWSVWLEIDCGIVSCFGAVKFSSGGQHSWSWLEVSETGETGETGETKRNKMWSWLAGLALYPWHPWHLRFLQKHLLDWVTWQSGARSSPWSKYNFYQGREGKVACYLSPRLLPRDIIRPGEMSDPSCCVCQSSGWWYQLTLVFTL